MSDYDIQLREQYKAQQQAAALTDKLNVVLTELGLELSAQYQVSASPWNRLPRLAAQASQ